MRQPGRLLDQLMEARIPLLPSLLLAGGFAVILVRYQKQLARMLRQEQLLRREVEIAREIQRAILASPPPHPCFDLVLYSDAFIEARNRAGELLEVEGLEALVRRHAALPPEALARRLIEETRAYGAVNDDLTLVVVRRRG